MNCTICDYPKNVVLMDSSTNLSNINNVLLHEFHEYKVPLCRDCFALTLKFPCEYNMDLNEYFNNLRQWIYQTKCEICNIENKTKVYVFPVNVNGAMKHVKLNIGDTEGNYIFHTLFDDFNLKLFHTSSDMNTLKKFIIGIFDEDVIYKFIKNMLYLQNNNLKGTIICDKDYNICILDIPDTFIEDVITLDDESNC